MDVSGFADLWEHVRLLSDRRRNRALIELLGRVQKRPSAILHGHEHHGFQSAVEVAGHPIPCVNSGSSGYKHMPEKRRAAAMNVYTIEGHGFSIERFMHDGKRFVPEEGGAYATGR